MPLRTVEEMDELKRMWEELDPTVKQQLEAEVEQQRREYEANPSGRSVVGWTSERMNDGNALTNITFLAHSPHAYLKHQ